MHAKYIQARPRLAPDPAAVYDSGAVTAHQAVNSPIAPRFTVERRAVRDQGPRSCRATGG